MTLCVGLATSRLLVHNEKSLFYIQFPWMITIYF